MTDENRYGEYECKARECSAVFMDPDVRDRHYRRAHGDEKNGNASDTDADRREHAPPLRKEELLNPPDGDRD